LTALDFLYKSTLKEVPLVVISTKVREENQTL